MKKINVLNLSTISLCLFMFSGCMSVKDGRTLKDDLFEANKRIVELERIIAEQSAETKDTGKAAAQRIASSTTKIERVEQTIQQLRGEIDTLRVAVTTGQMPGQEGEAAPSGSITETLVKINDRLDKLEEAQVEIINILDKNSKKKDKKLAGSSSSDSFDFKAAFSKKMYTKIISLADEAIKTAKGKEAREIKFYQAESLFKLGQYREATLKYNVYNEFYPSDRNIPHIQMRMGDCFNALGDSDTAKIYYQDVIQKFPGTESATASSGRLEKLKKKKSA